MIKAIYAANFVIMLVLFKNDIYLNLKVHFSKWTSKLKFWCNITENTSDWYANGYLVWNAIQIHAEADQHYRAERLFHWRYGVIYPKSSLILRQSYYFASDFNSVLLQLVDVLNTLYELLAKSCAKFGLLFVNIQWKTECWLEINEL